MKKILSILITFLCTLGINAQIPLGGSTEENPVEIKAGECYLLPTDFISNAFFTFQSEANGVLYLNLSKPLRLFGENGPLPLFGTQCIQGVQAGKKYSYHSTSTWGDSITMTVSFVEGKPYLPVSLSSCSLTDGDTYRTTQHDGEITFSFNIPINAAAVKADLILEDGSTININSYRTSEDYNTQGTNYVLLFAETYKDLLEKELLKAGDSFTISLSNIVSSAHAENKYDGSILLHLKASGKAIKLENVSNQEKLQSYYMPGDEAGLITLTFTGPVTCTAESAIMSYGDREAGTWTEIKVPYTVNENTITWNVQGIHLTSVPTDDEGIRYVNIRLSGICDEEGSPIESNADGTIGTILFSYIVETMEIDIYPDFLPAAGSNIDKTDEIEIWISAGKYITFENAKITYLKDGQTVTETIPATQLRQEDDPYSDIDLLVYVPVASYEFEEGTVIVELTNVLAANGTSPEIKVTYKSEGGRVSHIEGIAEASDKVVNTWQLNGMSTPTLKMLQHGIYLQKTEDGKVRKILIKE